MPPKAAVQAPEEAHVDLSWMEPSKMIWIEQTEAGNTTEIFQMAVLNSFDPSHAVVTYKKDGKQNKQVPVKLVFERASDYTNQESIGFEDMVNMEIINDAELLKNLQVRYKKDIICTYVGPTLLVVNPFRGIPGIVGEAVKSLYIGDIIFKEGSQYKDLPASVYALAAEAFRCLFENKKGQAIVISGESGAGKTENAKSAMNLLTSIGQFAAERDNPELRGKPRAPGIEDRILSCNPILESFGNAKTVRNNNSSRFGKYVSMIVELASKKVRGAQIINYLLEKSRIVSPGPNERNFHIFYFFMKGCSAQELEKYHLAKNGVKTSLENIRYLLSPTNSYEVKGVNDIELWQEITESFQTLGLGKFFEGVFQVVAAVLLMGNLSFNDQDMGDSSGCKVEPSETVKSIADLLSIAEDQVCFCLTMKQIEMQKKFISSPLKANECEAGRDSWAKTLYERLFNWLVLKLNETIAAGEIGESAAIGLLDIYGFEVFDKNGFEQIMINFTNEKLHQLYISYVFKEERTVFVKEGLEQYCGMIKYTDNGMVMELLVTKKLGVFEILDESCSIKTQDDLAFLNNIRRAHATNPLFKNPKMLHNPIFTIVHTAKDVDYTVTNFREKNNDEVSLLTLKVNSASTNPVIQELFAGSLDTTAKKDKTLSQKIRRQLDELMRDLNACEVHFIRCIKPNDEKVPQLIDQDYTLKQIRYLGVLDSLRVRKVNYPVRRLYTEFFMKYGSMTKNKIYPQLVQEKADFKKLTIALFKDYYPKLNEDMVLFGDTKVFLKIEAMPEVQGTYTKVMSHKVKMAIIWQRGFHRYMMKKALKKIHRRFQFYQRKVQSFRRKIQNKKILKSVIVIQRWYRQLMKDRKQRQFQVQISAAQMYFHRAAVIAQHKRFMDVVLRLQKQLRRHMIMKQLRQQAMIKLNLSIVLDRAWLQILTKKIIIIQKYFRGMIVRRKYAKEIIQIKEVGRQCKIRVVVIKIQKVGRGYIVRERLRKMHRAATCIQRYWKMKTLSELYQRMRSAAVVIQRAVRVYLKERKAQREQNTIYVEPLEKALSQSREENYEALFPTEPIVVERGFSGLSPFSFTNTQSPGNKKAERSSPQSKKVFEYIRKKTYTDEVLAQDIDNQILNPRMVFFAFIIDLEILADTGEYFQPSWAHQFRVLFENLYSQGNAIQTIHVGSQHVVATTVLGRVFSWGCNDNLQCGGEWLSTRPSTMNISYLSARVSMASLGDEHSLLLCYDGTLYGFGDNQFGQLMGSRPCYEMKSINIQSPVKSVTTTLNTSFAVCEDGCVYTWPVRDHNNQPLMSPLQLLMPVGVQVALVSAGNQFAMILTTVGCLYALGENQVGELGLGDVEPRQQPTLVSGSRHLKWDQVSCGFKHTVAKSSLGTAFVWGWGAEGQMGNGSFSNSLFPLEIQSRPSSVCAGHRTTILVMDPKTILWCGTNSRIVKQPHFINLKMKELSQSLTEPHFSIIRAVSSYSRTTSVIYLTFANHRYMFKNNPNNERKVIQQLSQRWAEQGTTSILFPSPLLLLVDPIMIPKISHLIAGKHFIKSKASKQKPLSPIMIPQINQKNYVSPNKPSPSKRIIKPPSPVIIFPDETLQLFDTQHYNTLPEFKLAVSVHHSETLKQVVKEKSLKNERQPLSKSINEPTQLQQDSPQFKVKKLKEIKGRLAELKKIPSAQWTEDDQEFLKNVYNSDLNSLVQMT